MAKSSAANGDSKFKKSWQAKTKGKWNAAREAKATKSLTAPKGVYIVRFTKVLYGADKNENPYFMFQFTLFSENPEYNGQVGSVGHFISEPTKKKPGSKQWGIEEKLQALAKDFQRLGKETDETDIDDLMEAAKQLTKEKPWGKIKIVPSDDPQYDDRVYIQSAIKEEDVPEQFLNPEDDDADDDDDEGDDDNDEEDDSETDDSDDGDSDDGDDEDEDENSDSDGEDDEDEDEDEDDEDEDEDPPSDFDDEEEEEPKKKSSRKSSTAKAKSGKTSPKPKKGQSVKYKGAKYVVHAVAANGTLALKDAKGKIVRNIDPSKVA